MLPCMQLCNSATELTNTNWLIRVFITTYENIHLQPVYINIWNSLPNNTVDAESINILKIRLDKYWSHQPLQYVYKTKTQNHRNRRSMKMWY